VPVSEETTTASARRARCSAREARRPPSPFAPEQVRDGGRCDIEPSLYRSPRRSGRQHRSLGRGVPPAARSCGTAPMRLRRQGCAACGGENGQERHCSSTTGAALSCTMRPRPGPAGSSVHGAGPEAMQGPRFDRSRYLRREAWAPAVAGGRAPWRPAVV
jgi:hypothetical protein